MDDEAVERMGALVALSDAVHDMRATDSLYLLGAFDRGCGADRMPDCARCAFREACVKRALSGGALRARQWLAQTQETSVIRLEG